MYTEWQPPYDLQDLVVCYWNLQLSATDVYRPVFPDGCADIIFNFGGALNNRQGSMEMLNSFPSFVVGTMTSPLLSSSQAPLHLVGIRFQPGGLRLVAGLPMHTLRDKVVPVADLPHISRALHKKPSSNGSGIYDFLSHWLRSNFHVTATESKILRLLNLTLHEQNQIRVKELAREAGYSIRQTERVFQEYVGVSPKEYLLISRFVHVQRQLDLQNQSPLLELAEHFGFHDHAHLTHVFKRFAGCTPSAYVQLRAARK